MKDGVKANPDLKGSSNNKGEASKAGLSHKSTSLPQSEREKAQDRLEKHDVVPSVFGSDRTTISAECQLVPNVTSKADAVGAKKLRGKYNLPGINGLISKGTPKPSQAEHFEGFLQALVQNFS